MSDTDVNRDYSHHGTEGLKMLSEFAPTFTEPTPEELAEYDRNVDTLLRYLDNPDYRNPDGLKMTFGAVVGFAFKYGYVDYVDDTNG